MADLTVTAASVTGVTQSILAGETITAGMSVYLKTSNNRWMKAQCDGTAEEAGSGTDTGIALHGSLNGQPLIVQKTGICTPGATVAVGTIYCISATAGGICPIDDLVSTNKVSILGIGATASTLDMSIRSYTGYAVP